MQVDQAERLFAVRVNRNVFSGTLTQAGTAALGFVTLLRNGAPLSIPGLGRECQLITRRRHDISRLGMWQISVIERVVRHIDHACQEASLPRPTLSSGKCRSAAVTRTAFIALGQPF